MTFKLIHSLICCTLVYGITLDDLIHVNGQESKEMMDKGRAQYQLLQERGKLPKYGSCWTAAVNQIHDGCRYLSEETQSDIALSLTNCFLQMSGHETYNCELDRKPNLRGICINSMSDRAFNVYTEFYTHAQNMCWFLRGQVWQETITENTFLVGKQLESSVLNQQEMLKNQQDTIALQEKMMNYTNDLNIVIEKFYTSTKMHHELMMQMSGSIGDLQSWLMGEVSWLDSIIFYIFATVISLTLTSMKRTANARLPILLVLVSNFVLERSLCKWFSSQQGPAGALYSNYYNYIVMWRNFCGICSVIFIVFTAYFHRDYIVENHQLLEKIYKRNEQIFEYLQNQGFKFQPMRLSNGINIPHIKGTPRKTDIHFKYESESSSTNLKIESEISPSNNKLTTTNILRENPHVTSTPKSNVRIAKESYYSLNEDIDEIPQIDITNGKFFNIQSRRHLPLAELQNNRYNLRSRNGTPDKL